MGSSRPPPRTQDFFPTPARRSPFPLSVAADRLFLAPSNSCMGVRKHASSCSFLTCRFVFFGVLEQAGAFGRNEQPVASGGEEVEPGDEGDDGGIRLRPPGDAAEISSSENTGPVSHSGGACRSGGEEAIPQAMEA
ncbi:unnamed protein product [Urochloa humidicola]